MIAKIFRHETVYEKEKQRIQNCVMYLKSGDKFHEFLNHVIRLHVGVPHPLCRTFRNKFGDIPNRYYMIILMKVRAARISTFRWWGKFTRNISTSKYPARKWRRLSTAIWRWPPIALTRISKLIGFWIVVSLTISLKLMILWRYLTLKSSESH